MGFLADIIDEKPQVSSKQIRAVCGAMWFKSTGKEYTADNVHTWFTACNQKLAAASEGEKNYWASKLEMGAGAPRDGLHLQFIAYHFAPRTHKTWATWLGSHQACKGTWRQNCDYVRKTKTSLTLVQKMGLRMEPTDTTLNSNFGLTMGEPEPEEALVEDDRTVKWEDLHKWQQSTVNLLTWLKDIKNDRCVVVIVDEEGGKGKTHMCRFLAQQKENLYTTGGKGADTLFMLTCRIMGDPDRPLKKPGTVDILISDITRSAGADNNDVVSYATAEKVCNGMWSSPKYKSVSVIVTNYMQQIILTNYVPKMEALSKDRWLILEIMGNELCVKGDGGPAGPCYTSLHPPHTCKTAADIKKNGWGEIELELSPDTENYSDLFGWQIPDKRKKKKSSA